MSTPTSDQEIALSATIILVREVPSMEVLMVQRSAKMGFAAGALVFPGGKVDEADQDAYWQSETLTHGTQNLEQLATQVAAIRELFEETGILLAYNHQQSATGKLGFVSTDHIKNAQQWRETIHQDARAFITMCEQESLTLAFAGLTKFAQWKTPPGLHRRFDTWFYVAPMPPEQHVLVDGHESTEALWASPQTLLSMGNTGAKKIIFPTARNLELLDKSTSYEDICAYAQKRPQECVEPSIVNRDGINYLTIPDHLGYPITEERLESAMRQ